MVAGGGTSHRVGLYDAILVKENHVRVAGGVGEAARRALQNAPAGCAVEVEVETLDELDEALDAGVDRVLLDNMGPDALRAAVARTAGRAELEASGGVTLETRARRRRDRRRLHLRRRAHPLGAGARSEPALRAGLRKPLHLGLLPVEKVHRGSFRHRKRFETCRSRRHPHRGASRHPCSSWRTSPPCKREVRALAQERERRDPGPQLPGARGPGRGRLRRRLARPLAPGGRTPAPT